MSTAYKLLPHYTYEDYCRWEGQWELIDGIPYAMAPLPSVRHQDISGNLYLLFREALKTANCPCKAYLPVDYKVTEDTILQPDLLVTCTDISKEKFIAVAPELVAEILLPYTAMKDLNSKFIIYEGEKIPYYLILDPDKENIAIYQLKNDKYQLAFSSERGSFTFLLHDQCSIEVSFTTVWS